MNKLLYLIDGVPEPASVNRRLSASSFTAVGRCAIMTLGAGPVVAADGLRIRRGEGVFWLAVVRDAFSRRIMGSKTPGWCDTI